MSQWGTYNEVGKLVGTGAVGSASQGWSVKWSEDGNFLFIGGYNDNNIGAVWFYEKINNVWTQIQKIVPTGYSGNPLFGWSIAVNPSMNTMIVGAHNDNSQVGASFVFTFNSTTWTQQGDKLVGNGVTGESQQGRAVALSADANTAIVGGPWDGSFVGAAWIFVRTGNAWSQQGTKLVANDYSGSYSFQGHAVALTSDGNLVVVGGTGDQNSIGAIWCFLRSGNSWNQVGTKITATGEIGAGQFGYSLELSGDDQTVVVGGSQDNSFVGAAWIFKRNGNTFTQFGNKLVGIGVTSNSFFGRSVAVNKLGTFVAVGAYGASNNVGAVWVYYFNGTNYNQLGNKIVAADAIGSALQGSSVSLDGVGSQLLFGGYNDNGGVGAAWIYTNSTISNSPTVTPTAPTMSPSNSPTSQPSVGPTAQPSLEPTILPSLKPTTKPTKISTPKPTSALSNTSSGAFLSLVTVIPVLVLVGLALMYFFFRVYKKQVNKEGAEMRNWIQGNQGEIVLHGKNFGESNNNEDDDLKVAPMDNPLQTSTSSRAISLNV